MAKLVEVIIPDNIKPAPEKHEVEVAWILARNFKCIVEFLKPVAGYRMKTADIVMNGIIWEIKSPQGKSLKSTTKRQFKGLKQSRSLIIYTARTNLDDNLIIEQIKKEKTYHRINQLIVVTKDKRVLDI